MFGDFLSRNASCISWVVLAHGLLILALLSAHSPREIDVSADRVMASLLSPASNIAASQVSGTSKATSRSRQVEGATETEPAMGSIGSNGASSSKREAGVRQKISGPRPHYPLISRRLREEGTVLVKLCINHQGSVQTLDVAQSSGSKNLDDSAKQALSLWKFDVAGALSHKTEDCFRMPVQFRLEG